MFKPVIRLKEGTPEKQLFMVPESDLEERFVLWFAFHNGVPRQRVNKRESLLFPIQNDPEQLQHNLTAAFNLFKKRYKYVEIPYLVGIPLMRAKEELRLRGLQWAIERKIYSDEYPRGFVISQNPLSDAVSTPHSVVYLSVSKGPKKAMSE